MRKKPAQPKKTPRMCAGCGFNKTACQCLELALLQQMRAVGLVEPVREFSFLKGRRFRADFAWPVLRLLVECEGGLHLGRHTSPAGYTRDMEKYNLAALDGWIVLRFGAREIRGGQAIAILEQFFAKEAR